MNGILSVVVIVVVVDDDEEGRSDRSVPIPIPLPTSNIGGGGGERTILFGSISIGSFSNRRHCGGWNNSVMEGKGIVAGRKLYKDTVHCRIIEAIDCTVP